MIILGVIKERERIRNRKEKNDKSIDGRLGEKDFRNLELQKQRLKKKNRLKNLWNQPATLLLEQRTPKCL